MSQRAALTYINKIRVFLGKKPLTKLKKGYRGTTNTCPLVRSLGNDFGITDIALIVPNVKLYEKLKKLLKNPKIDFLTSPRTYYYLLPKRVKKFVDDFDTGKYPELDLDDEELKTY